MSEPRSLRTFAFYPPVLNVEHNEWRFRKETHSETLVTNTKSGVEFWIPNRLIGEISGVGADETIVNLLEELEYRNGTVAPREPRIFEMPRSATEMASIPPVRRPARTHAASCWVAVLAVVCVLAGLLALVFRR